MGEIRAEAYQPQWCDSNDVWWGAEEIADTFEAAVLAIPEAQQEADALGLSVTRWRIAKTITHIQTTHIDLPVVASV